MRKKVDEETIDQMIDLWRDRLPTKAIALKMGLSYTTVFKQLKKRSLIG